MVQRQVDKVVATQLLEATKSVLEHVSHWMIELNDLAQDPPAGLSQIYGKARRLRDYLHRSVAAYGRSVNLDLSEEDQNILVSCIVHHIGAIDLQLEGGVTGDAEWLEEKRRNLSECAISLATRPVARIPSRDRMQSTTTNVRAVTAAIAQRTMRLPGAANASDPTHGGQAWQPPESGGPQFGGGPPSAGAPLQPTYPQGGGYSGPDSSPDPQYSSQIGYQESDVGGAATPVYPQFLESATGGSGGDNPARPSELPLDPQRVSDPRLRAMAAMDARAFERTMASEDYRLAMVHLASIFEAVVLDYVIPRQRTLDIKGPPETWRFEQVLGVVLGDKLTSMDRPCVLQFVAARHLVRPAIQIHSPMVVTRATLQKAIEFCKGALVELGYAGSAKWSAPPGQGGTPGMPGADPDAPIGGSSGPSSGPWDNSHHYA